MDYQSFQPGSQDQSALPPPMPETPKIQNLSERLRLYQWHIAIVGVVLIALLFGAYSYSKYLAQQNDDALAKQAEDAQKKIDEIRQKRAQDVTSTWKTYTNTQYGFEFKYPAKWNVINLNTSGSANFEIAIDPILSKVPEGDQPFAMTFRVYKSLADLDYAKKNPKSLEDFLKKYSEAPDPLFSEAGPYNIKDATAYKTTETGFANFTTYYFQHRSLIFEIPTFYDDEILIDQILSTFKFTK